MPNEKYTLYTKKVIVYSLSLCIITKMCSNIGRLKKLLALKPVFFYYNYLTEALDVNPNKASTMTVPK